MYCPVGDHREMGWPGRSSSGRADPASDDTYGAETASTVRRASLASDRPCPRRRTRSRTSPASRVGHTTLIEGDDVRTGVTVVLPPPEPLFAGCHRINGNGELTGLEWIRDSGLLTTPIGLTNTHSVGVVRDALIAEAPPGEDAWSLPVVGETWDGFLNDINGFHVRLRARQDGVRGGHGHARRGKRRRRHRHDLPRLQGRHRHVLAHGRGRLDGGCARAGEPRPAPAAASERGRGRRAHRPRRGAAPGHAPRAPARSSSSSPPTRRSSRASASGSRAGPASGSRAPAASASTRAATSRSASRRATAASTRRSRRSACGC